MERFVSEEIPGIETETAQRIIAEHFELQNFKDVSITEIQKYFQICSKEGRPTQWKIKGRLINQTLFETIDSTERLITTNDARRILARAFGLTDFNVIGIVDVGYFFRKTDSHGESSYWQILGSIVAGKLVSKNI